MSIRGAVRGLQTAILLHLLLLVVSCAPSSRSILDDATKRGFAETSIHTEAFTLFGMLRPGNGNVLHVYIEGDGHAWDTPSQPSADPTPRNPVALRLAMADDTGAPVLYLARPCQYVQGDGRRGCHVRFWTSARLGDEVIASLNEAVTEAKRRIGASNVALFGFSGGGGAVVLLAARRNDVACLATVAGLLDTDGWTARMRVSPLTESLNPLDVAHRLRSVPQIHLCSRDDNIVPPEIAETFCKALGRPDCRIVYHDIAHTGAWEKAFPNIFSQLKAQCQPPS